MPNSCILSAILKRIPPRSLQELVPLSARSFPYRFILAELELFFSRLRYFGQFVLQIPTTSTRSWTLSRLFPCSWMACFSCCMALKTCVSDHSGISIAFLRIPLFLTERRLITSFSLAVLVRYFPTVSSFAFEILYPNPPGTFGTFILYSIPLVGLSQYLVKRCPAQFKLYRPMFL